MIMQGDTDGELICRTRRYVQWLAGTCRDIAFSLTAENRISHVCKDFETGRKTATSHDWKRVAFSEDACLLSISICLHVAER